MNLRRVNKRTRKGRNSLLASLLLLATALLISGCGGGTQGESEYQENSSPRESENSSIVFDIDWRGTNNSSKTSGSFSSVNKIDCAASGVSLVEVRVLNHNNATIGEESKNTFPGSC